MSFMVRSQGLWPLITKSVDHFFFKPASAKPLAIFRIGLSLVLLWQAFSLLPTFHFFLGEFGFVQREVSNILSDPSIPRLYWILDFLSSRGASENSTLTALGIIYITSLFFLLSGAYTRFWAFIAWFLHWSFLNTGYSGAYGADMYCHFFLFYLIFIPSHKAWSLDCLFKRVNNAPSIEARISLRILQLHMCISYLASGLEKATGEQWWNGEVMWIALNTPGYSIADFHWLANWSFIPIISGIVVLAIEIFYCLFIWGKKTRYAWIFLTCLLHLGIAVFLNLPIFGVLMCIPTISLFAFSAEVEPEPLIINKKIALA